MLGLASGQIQLSPYESGWQLLFLEERDRLEARVGEYVLDIQHIGSTSIPGMPAKPILDIGIAVTDFEEAVRCIKPLENLGYTYKGENGIPRRHYFVKGTPRTHHLHMVEIESEAWKNHLLFRDYLIKHPETAREYATLKQELAKQFANDRGAYQVGKESFIKTALLKATKAKDLIIPTGARTVARVLLMSDRNRLLLLHAKDRSGRQWWLSPGGGLEEGETFETAAQRELHEETGLLLPIGQWVWFRRHVYTWEGRSYDQYERFFVARSKELTLAPQKADSYLTGHRWWTINELLQSKEDFAPRQLAHLLPPILAGEYPEPAIDCGV